MKKLVAIPYFGGKSLHLDWLYRHMPAASHLVDAMCGGGCVGLNAPHPLVTINDLNKDVYNFFYVLRNNYDEFKAKIKYTPFSRDEFRLAAQPCRNKIEKARRSYLRAMQGFAGQGSQDGHVAWGYEVSAHNNYNSRPRKHFRVDTWCSKTVHLEQVAERLRNIQIENDTVFNVIKRFNHQNVLLYIDPPYDRATRADKKRYKHEWDAPDHELLAEALQDFKGYVAISGYDGALYHRLFSLENWHKTYDEVRFTSTVKVPRQEVLWTNYNPADFNTQKKLF